MINSKQFLALIICVASTVNIVAQDNYAAAVYNVDRPSTSIAIIEVAPTIDGNIIGDEVWQAIAPVTEMKQLQPNYGFDPSEKTEIRMAQTPTMLYVSAICYDSNPELLVVSDARRDAPLDNTDAFLFVVDTYHDGRNGFMFGTNTLGAEYDAQVDNEGQGNFNSNRQQGGVIGGFNLNWDASWEVKTEVGEYGWSAEFAIPLRTIRFASGDDITWGLNFRRNIRKTNEINYWALLPLGLDLKRLSLAGDLEGLKLQSPNNLKFIPYALTAAAKDFTVPDSETDYDGEVGADVKYSITPAITLDLTYNTDFAQVEVDDQQVNLDRFNLFFPEKRPFFLENAGLFSVGSPGEVDLFFSRRIGIGDGGRQVPIIGGARLSGKANMTNIGILSMFTDDVQEDGIIQNNFSVARINHEFQGRSAIGGAYVSRIGMGDEVEDDYNRTFAIDGRYGIGKRAQVGGYFARSSTPGIESDQYSYKANAEYVWGGWNIFAGYTEVGEGFNPEVGFLLRTAFRKPEFRVLYHLRPKNPDSPFLELRPHISYRGYWNFEGFQETGFLHIDNHWEFKSGTEVHTGINFTTEGVVQDFEIVDGVTVPAGTYDHAEAQIIFFTNRSNPFAISTRHVLGGFFGGKRYANTVSAFVRVGDKFTSEFSLRRNDIRLPNGNFNTNIFSSRISYNFKPNLFLQSLIQYNSVASRWSANVRFAWLQRANSGLFLVFNQVQEDRFGVENRSFIVKYTHLFDVLN
ncbi:MAG: carbohydrate binding family 9 domain-containing protein, partial [Saprospiraceae bacterium]|nr:carbohydrate binding family 9 domain-containing protein [Saprospiraceae bacterium]